MKERPILFSGPMVRAILDGSKTQTRRIVKPQPSTMPITNGSADGTYEAWPNGDSCLDWGDVVSDPLYYAQAGYCPHGQPGDRLWVRETWAHDAPDLDTCRRGVESDGLFCGPYYRATARDFDQQSLTWRPSIFMPRWASRITLEITDVRVQRVQEIAPEDAMHEGVTAPLLTDKYTTMVGGFAHLWDSINAKRGYSWANNPWVWALTFRRIV